MSLETVLTKRDSGQGIRVAMLVAENEIRWRNNAEGKRLSIHNLDIRYFNGESEIINDLTTQEIMNHFSPELSVFDTRCQIEILQVLQHLEQGHEIQSISLSQNEYQLEGRCADGTGWECTRGNITVVFYGKETPMIIQDISTDFLCYFTKYLNKSDPVLIFTMLGSINDQRRPFFDSLYREMLSLLISRPSFLHFDLHPNHGEIRSRLEVTAVFRDPEGGRNLYLMCGVMPRNVIMQYLNGYVEDLSWNQYFAGTEKPPAIIGKLDLSKVLPRESDAPASPTTQGIWKRNIPRARQALKRAYDDNEPQEEIDRLKRSIFSLAAGNARLLKAAETEIESVMSAKRR